MTTRGRRAVAVGRILVELTLAAFAIWLVVQNALLLWHGPWAVTPPALVLAGALLKTGRILITALWPWPLMIFAISAMLGAALTAGLLGGIATREARRV